MKKNSAPTIMNEFELFYPALFYKKLNNLGECYRNPETLSLQKNGAWNAASTLFLSMPAAKEKKYV